MDEALLQDGRLTAVGLLVEVYGGLTRRLDVAHGRAGISGSDFDVLIRLARSRDRQLRMTDLAAQTGLSASGITRIVDRLEHRGLVRRTACAGDRRSSLILISESGQSLLAQHLPELAKVIDECFTGLLTASQLEAFSATLHVLREGLHPNATAGSQSES